MTIPLEEIVYLHCHQQGGSNQLSINLDTTTQCLCVFTGFFYLLSVSAIKHSCQIKFEWSQETISPLSPVVDSGGTVVLVSQDGIQRPPLRFPRGGHLLQFLSCLENGLLPHGQLDPPLWSQRGKVSTGGLSLGSLSGFILGILLENKMLNQPYLINKSIKKTFGFGNRCTAWLHEWYWWMRGLMFSLRHHIRTV